MPSLQGNLYANGHLAQSLCFCFLKIGLRLFKALQPALKDPGKQGVGSPGLYHKARKEMLKRFPKAVTLEVNMYAIWVQKSHSLTFARTPPLGWDCLYL